MTRCVTTRITGVNEDAPICATGKATVNFPLLADDGESTHVMKLEDVLCGDQIKGPALISMGRLTAAGYKFLLSNDDCFIFDEHLHFIKNVKRTANFMYEVVPAPHDTTGGRLGVPFETLERLLKVHAKYWEGGRKETATCLFGLSYVKGIGDGGRLDLLKAKHEMYGHHNVLQGRLHRRLEKIHGSAIASAIAKVPCEACLLTRINKHGKGKDKHHRRPVTRFLDRWHMDCKVIMGYLYLVILDEHLNLGWALLLRDRGEAAVIFRPHLRREMRHARARYVTVDVDLDGAEDDPLEGSDGLRQLRMDDAKEFTKGAMRGMVEELGVAPEIRIADDPEQSGRVEAWGGQIADHAKAMLKCAHAPAGLLPYAIDYYTTYIHPRIPSKANNGKPFRGVGDDDDTYETAYEAYHGVHIDPLTLDKQVHAWGSKVVVLIEKKHRRKMRLDPALKGVTGMLLGKAPAKKGWTVLILATMEIGYFSNVVIVECEYPCREPEVRESLIKAGLALKELYPVNVGGYTGEFTDGGVAAKRKAGRPPGKAVAPSEAGGDEDASEDEGEEPKGLDANRDARKRLGAGERLVVAGLQAAFGHREAEPAKDGGLAPRKLEGALDEAKYDDEPAENLHEVEEIKGKRRGFAEGTTRRVDQFEVKWKGFPDSENSWEERHRLKGAPEAMESWEARQGEAKAAAAVAKEAKRRVPAKPPEPVEGRRRSSRLAGGAGDGGPAVEAEEEAMAMRASSRGGRGESIDAAHEIFAKLATVGSRRGPGAEEGAARGRVRDLSGLDAVAHQLAAATDRGVVGHVKGPGSTPPPMSEREVVGHPYGDYYRAAGRHEKAALMKRGTLKRLVPIKEVLAMGKKPAKSRMLYGWKSDMYHKGDERGPAGERAKGRWIICGYSMVEFLDYDKTASPSADMTVWRIMLSLSVMMRGCERLDEVFDVTTAYLWALKDRKFRTFMEQAKGYEEPGTEGMCWELGTHLYGEPDAGLGWFKELSEMFLRIGYTRNPSCPSLFFKLTRKGPPSEETAAWYDDEENRHRRVMMTLPDGTEGVLGRDVWATYVLMQVDDGKVVSNCPADLAELKEALVGYDTKWHEPCIGFLGAEETWTGPDEKTVTARAQIDKFVDRYEEHLTGRARDVPMDPASKYEPKPGMDAASAKEREIMRGLPYREMVGSLSYIARVCHASIAYAVNGLAQYVSDPGVSHWKLMQYLADFVATQRETGMVFRAPERGTRQLVLVCDANWAGDTATRRSVDNSLVFLWGNLVDFGPKKQKFTAVSSFESELGASARGGGRLKAVGAVILGMGIQIELPVPTYGDNESVLNSLTNVTHGSSAKHIDIRMFWMKGEIEYGVFEMLHVLSGGNMADVMTKPLGGKAFWPLMWDLTGKFLTDVGRRIRRGLYAYRRAEDKHRMLVRPTVAFHRCFPGPETGDYHGKAEAAQGAATGDGGCGY